MLIIIVRIQYLALLILCVLTLFGYRSLFPDSPPIIKFEDGKLHVYGVKDPLVVVEGCGKKTVVRASVIDLKDFEGCSISVTVYSKGIVKASLNLTLPNP